jgi:hypothetical protein
MAALYYAAKQWFFRRKPIKIKHSLGTVKIGSGEQLLLPRRHS